MRYFIKVKGFFNEQTEGHAVTFKTVEEDDLLDYFVVLHKMLDSDEIYSYEVSIENKKE